MKLKESLEYTNVISLIDKCPFCGGIAEYTKYPLNRLERKIFKSEENDGCWHLIFCSECFAQGQECLTKEDAIEKWNRRDNE